MVPLETLYGLDLSAAENLMKTLGAPRFRAKQMLEWMYHKQALVWEDLKNIPQDLKEQLAQGHRLSGLTFVEAKDSGNGESIKFLFRTHDERLLESVLILQQDRQTVCVSTQLGCKIGCVFCASGKGKFGRNLTPGEIVEQVAHIQKYIDIETDARSHAKGGERPSKVTNIVFMGMGEPLDNFDATMKALDILQAPWGFAMGSRRITVSTSGITPRIKEFVERHQGRVRLSVSLHASNETLRSQLVPINKKYTLTELVETLNEISEELKRSITFEYTLIDGVNDSESDAEGVAKIAAPLGATVNVIPYNPIREMDFKTPTMESIDRFEQILEKYKVRVTIRQTAGRDIDGACGQLRLDREESKSHTAPDASHKPEKI